MTHWPWDTITSSSALAVKACVARIFDVFLHVVPIELLLDVLKGRLNSAVTASPEMGSNAYAKLHFAVCVRDPKPPVRIPMQELLSARGRLLSAFD